MRKTFFYMRLIQYTNSDIRQQIYEFTFCKTFEFTVTWENLSDYGKVIIPKKVNIINSTTGQVVSNKATANFSNQDISYIFAVGDRVQIKAGYDENYSNIDTAPWLMDGWVSEVKSDIHLEIEIEDHLWVLKQIQAPTKYWGNIPLQIIIQQCLDLAKIDSNRDNIKRLKDINLSVSNSTELTSIQYNIGTFRTDNETVAQILSRLKKDYHIDSYIQVPNQVKSKGLDDSYNILRLGVPIYDPIPTVDNLLYAFNLTGQGSASGIPNLNINSKNIPLFNAINRDKLIFSRTDWISLSAIGRSVTETFTGKTTKDGQQSTTKTRLEILVYFDKNKGDFTFMQITKDKPNIPANLGGERRVFPFNNITDVNSLYLLTLNELKKYYYTGFKGSFETFLYPIVEFGDVIYLQNQQLQEQNGIYVVRGVKYIVDDTKGVRQEIELDYKLD